MNKMERNFLILRRFRIGVLTYTPEELEKYCELMWRISEVREKISKDYDEGLHLRTIVRL